MAPLPDGRTCGVARFQDDEVHSTATQVGGGRKAGGARADHDDG